MPLVTIKDFRVPEEEKVKLSKWPTRIEPYFSSAAEYKKILSVRVKQISDLQQMMAAHDRYALLLIFQGMDGSGKDGAISHVMSGINPQGCQVYSFKQPSTLELHHDFLWRALCRLPERGRIGIFNRSYYEEVLVVRIHPDILAKQNLPDDCLHKNVWQERYESILDWEKHLHRNGTRIVKFFLHMSKDEQRKRFLERIDNPEKNWKFSSADIAERHYWDDYMQAFGECLSATSTKHAPWYVIPADDKPTARLIISEIILETMKKLKMSYPETDKQRREDLLQIRKTLL